MFMRVQRFPVSFDPMLSFEREFSDMFDNSLPASIARTQRRHPAVDIAEYENESVIVAEVPGVQKEDLKISVHDGVLTIAGQRKAQQLSEKSSWLRNEIRTGKFTRTIQLPHEVNTDGISAELTNGVLRMVLPKSEQIRPREIKVQ